MKSKRFIRFIFLFFLSASTFAYGESPRPGTDDTISSNILPDLPAAAFPLQRGLIVNEDEVRAGLLYDAVNSKIIWQKNMTSAFPIASLTKMMVALLAVEDVKAGLISWEDTVKWTRETYVGRGKRRKKLCTAVNYSLKDVFKASMIASNNECAEQMAIFLGCGNLQSTIDRMNARAKDLQMNNTFYGNPTGLPAPHSMFDNSSTPSDLLLLSLEMLKYQEVTDIAAMGYASIENGKSSSVIRNHNRLTIDYSGEVDGLKTGYTRRAGFCLVATTAKCDHRLISIVLGCRGPQIRNEIVRDMVNDYYASIGLDKLGPYCPTPLAPKDGYYASITETVKKIHRVKSGESISKIAGKYNCTTAQLKSWNKKNTRNNKVYQGTSLAIYVKQTKKVFIAKPANGNENEDDQPLITDAEKKMINSAEQEVEASTPTVEKSKPSEKYVYHTVVHGDTLFNIARRYDGTTVDELKELNKINDTRSLKPGQKLKVKVQG